MQRSAVHSRWSKKGRVLGNLATLVLMSNVACTNEGALPQPPGPIAPVETGHLTSASRSSDIRKDERGREYVAGQLIVRYQKERALGVDKTLSAQLRAEVIHTYRASQDLQVLRYDDRRSIEEVVDAFQKDPAVLYAEPNYIVHAASLTPNDPSFNQLWGLNNTGTPSGQVDADINAPEAWDYTIGSAANVIAVMDTGIDYTHPDLVANMWVNPGEIAGNGVDDDNNGYIDDIHGINAITNSGNPMDDNNHGTHCAGTIAGRGNNGAGVVGVSWTTRLMACKFLNANRSGSTADAIKCLDYIHVMKTRANNPAPIVATNNSWEATSSQAVHDGVKRHLSDGILFIKAAGNSNSDKDFNAYYDALDFLPNVISVASSTRSDTLASSSNYGRRSVHVTAPGESIYSSIRNGGYASLSGTSMAASHVSGLAALLKAQNPNRDWKQIKNLILTGGQKKSAFTNTVTGRRIRAWDVNGVGSLSCDGQVINTRVKPVGEFISRSVNQPIDLSVYNIRCGTPLGAPTVVITGKSNTTITLSDTGTGGDLAADDGLYFGQFIPSTYGTYTLTFPDGETMTLNVAQPYLPPIKVSFGYRTITGTNLNLSDDSATTITPGFPIHFANVATGYSRLTVAMNGAVSLSTPLSTNGNDSLPTSTYQEIIAPFWDDLYPNSAAAGNVYWAVIGAAPSRELVIEWRNVYHYSSDKTNPMTFQVIFYEDRPDIRINYKDVYVANSTYDYGASATVGVQTNPVHATQFSYNTPSLANETSYLWLYCGECFP